MEDKRITKTKNSIRQAVIRLLDSDSYEDLSVTEICKAANVSRITFYTYYNNKNDVIADMYCRYIAEASDIYHRLQAGDNPEDDVYKGYMNLLTCIIKMYFNNYDFFRHTMGTKNPYLSSEFMTHAFYYIDDYLQRHDGLVTKYPRRQTAAFICNGLFSAAAICSLESYPELDTTVMLTSMFKDILFSDIFEHSGSTTKSS